MTNRERIESLFGIRKEIDQLADRIAELDKKLCAPKTQQYTGMPFAQTQGNAMEEGIERLEEMRSLYRNKKAYLESEQMAVEEIIDVLSPKERIILRYRFIDGLPWKDVANKAHYCRRTCSDISKQALDKL